MFPVVEIFTSIQGEGCNLGKAANFIRFAGCNLKCPWCDTDWQKAKMGQLSIEQIMNKLDSNVDLVVLTGGEPTIQKGLESLIHALVNYGYKVAIETNGTNPTKELKRHFPDVWIACSPKPETHWSISEDCVYDELKYVIDEKIKKKNIKDESLKPIWLQPEGSHMLDSWQKALMIQKQLKKQKLDIRIGVQLHKIMEVR